MTARPVVTAAALPPGALLQRYGESGGFADCYRAEVAGAVALEAFVRAFYTSRAFRPERWLLGLLARRPATDDGVQALAAGRSAGFAAWCVEARTAHELLLADDTGRTRSWLAVAPDPGGTRTTLCFGSAIVPRVDARTGARRMGLLFHALLGFHGAYSRALLRSAVARLARDRAAG